MLRGDWRCCANDGRPDLLLDPICEDRVRRLSVSYIANRWLARFNQPLVLPNFGMSVFCTSYSRAPGASMKLELQLKPFLRSVRHHTNPLDENAANDSLQQE